MKSALLITLLLVLGTAHAERDSHRFNFNAASSESTGGQATANNSGITVRGEDDDSRFFSFATTFPQASGCLGGAQGGAGGSSSSGFFGMHFINHDCWTSALAEAEANVEVRALLKCAGKHFRNAIAFDQGGDSRDKQRYCVDYMVVKYDLEIERTEALVDQLIEEGELEVTTAPIVVAGNITQEEFEEQAQRVEDKNAQQQNQIDELERRAVEAERKAAAAEQALQKIQRQQTSKAEALQQLQQQIREDYATIPTE